MNYTTQIPSDADAFRKGFNRGYSLCLNMKKMSRDYSSILRSIMSREFHHSFGKGLSSGYSCGLKFIEKQLQHQHLKEAEKEAPPSKITFQERDDKNAQKKRLEQRMWEIDLIQGRNPEREREERER